MKKRRNWFLAGIYVLVVTVNMLSWHSKKFCNQIRKSIFRMTQYIQGHISSLFPFSVGEFLLMLAVLLAAALALFVVLCAGRVTKESEKKETVRKFAGRYYCLLLWVIAVTSVVMSINCFVLYHCSSFSEMYMPGSEREYKVRELALVRDHVVRQCNELAEQMERDENGYIVYRGDMERLAVAQMERLGEEYPLFDGYYPDPKALTFSGFFSQQYIMGYYFPFSMEANYNDVMHILNFPSTMCHELAHLRGYIYEDEANFIGYLACVESEDVFFQYAGYLSVLVYLNNDLYKAWKEERAAYEEAAAIVCPVAVNAQVWEDNIFVTEEEWERINGKALIDTEIVDKAADVFIDANLKVNGVADGKISYSRVVRLLLQYYRQNPEEAGAV